MPLLFDDELKAKPAFWGIVDPSRLMPNINEEDVLQSEEKDWSLAQPVNISSDGKSSMKLLWKDGAFYVQVTVKDTTDDAEDKVTIYLDKDNAKADNANGVETVTIKRSEAKATADGYVAEKEFNIAGKAANANLGLDVTVSDGATGNVQCWNDMQMKQAERSKYYGTVTLKPFMVINKGSAVVDAEIDEAWNDVTPYNLTVSSNPASSTKGTVKTMWDEDYLYVLMQVQDSVLNKDNANEYEQDSVEIFIDENNGKTEAYEEDDCQYRINYKNELSFNGENCIEDNIQSAAKETGNGYVIEAKIKFNKVKGANNNLICVDFQINDADASGTRTGTINWYDASGMGYAKPAVFGTAKLSDGTTPSEPSTPNEPGKDAVDISTASISGIKNYSYTGEEIKQAITVEAAGKQLAEGTDYTVSYNNNINAGNAEVTITGCGDYTGTVTKAFKITKAKQKIQLKKTSYKKVVGSKSFKLSGIKAIGKLTYKSSKKSVATVNKKGKVTIKGKGTAKITVTAAGDKNHKKATATVKVKVTKK